jgi:phospholipid-binding lipoprotein MlaA
MTVATFALALALSMAPAEPAAALSPDATQSDAASAATPSIAVPAIPMAPAPPSEGQPDAVPATPATPPPAGPENKPAGDDIVVTAREQTPGDPLADLNAKSYVVIQAVDQAVVGPVSMGYKSGMPRPLRLGLRNFLRNLEEPVIAFNYLLQLKPGRAVKSVGRFAVNSTIGVGGLVDMAKRKPFNLP